MLGIEGLLRAVRESMYAYSVAEVDVCRCLLMLVPLRGACCWRVPRDVGLPFIFLTVAKIINQVGLQHLDPKACLLGENDGHDMATRMGS